MKLINNRYKIIKKLGEGGMGAVYLAEDKLYNQKVALKTIRKEIARQEIIDRFKVEFEVMTRLKHPNLAMVYDFGFDGETQNYFITMEYVEGATLRRFETFARLEVILDIFVNLLRAIEFIHSRKILHRDIKPENIMIITEKGKRKPENGKRRPPKEGENSVSGLPSPSSVIILVKV